MKTHTKSNGFTIIEIMIVVAILGILATIALPSYQQYVIKSRRADATTELMKLAAEQEKYYLQNNSYANEAQLATYIKGVATTDLTTQYSYYGIDVKGDGGATTAIAYQQGFVITATPPAASAQSIDKKCTSFIIDETGLRSATGTTTAKCWK